MLSIKVILVALCAVGVSMALVSGQTPITDHYQLHDACADEINEQISWELYASVVYLNMAGYFDRPTVARPGYAKFFKDQSLEEHGHAAKFIDYVNKRNGTVKGISIDESQKYEWSSPREALADAIKLEKHVYAKIQHIHSVAEQKCFDAHLTDFLESYYFTEQVDSINELQNMLTVITTNDASSTAVIEHMEDVRLQKGKKD